LIFIKAGTVEECNIADIRRGSQAAAGFNYHFSQEIFK